MEEEEMGFCHQCKQYKSVFVMAQCKYDSKKHGLMLPVVYDINGISIPNVEPQHTDLINHFILIKVSPEKRRKTLNIVND